MPTTVNPPNADIRTLHARVAKETKRVVVGLDFGTSTTKVMYRTVELSGRTRLIDFAHGHRQFPPYAMPSSVRFDNEHRLWFGNFAEEGEGQVFRSFKVCVACQAGAIANCGCKQNRFDGNATADGLVGSLLGFAPAHELMVYYLAWLLPEVDKIIQKELGELVEPELQYNIGVPVPHLNAKPKLAHLFEWLLHAALALRGKIQQGISATQARVHFLEVLPDAMLPPLKYRRHRALPETAAAAMWLQKNANDNEIANYMLIDIGAGTTDITFYRYNRTNPNVPIYGASSISVAGDNIDLSTLQWFAKACGREIESLAQVSSTLRQELRRRKEFLPTPNKTMEAILGSMKFALDENTYIEKIVQPHAASIHNEARQTFIAARRLDNPKGFRKIRIVMLGGGSKIPGMRKHIERRSLHDMIKQQDFITPRIPEELTQLSVFDFSILAVAYGLAFPPAEFPDFKLPNQIEPLAQPTPQLVPEYNQNALLSN